MIKLIFKSSQDAWVGMVVSKNYNEKRDMDHPKRKEHFYSLRIKTDDGREFGWAVTSAEYFEYKEGDRLQKLKGKLKAEKI